MAKVKLETVFDVTVGEWRAYATPYYMAITGTPRDAWGLWADVFRDAEPRVSALLEWVRADLQWPLTYAHGPIQGPVPDTTDRSYGWKAQYAADVRRFRNTHIWRGEDGQTIGVDMRLMHDALWGLSPKKPQPLKAQWFSARECSLSPVWTQTPQGVAIVMPVRL